MSSLTLVSIVLALCGVLLCIIGIQRLLRRRIFSALKLEMLGLVLCLFAAAAFLLASNLYLYDQLVYEAPVAEIEFIQSSPQRFIANIKRGEQMQYYAMQGDEWQLDVQMLVWHGYASVLGLEPQYRLHRLSGRYTDIDDEVEQPRSVHALSEKADIDLWLLASQNQRLIAWLLDASYGSAVYLPMSDKARYQISINRTGLVARPMNAPAKQAVSRWIGL